MVRSNSFKYYNFYGHIIEVDSFGYISNIESPRYSNVSVVDLYVCWAYRIPFSIDLFQRQFNTVIIDQG